MKTNHRSTNTKTTQSQTINVHGNGNTRPDPAWMKRNHILMTWGGHALDELCENYVNGIGALTCGQVTALTRDGHFVGGLQSYSDADLCLMLTVLAKKHPETYYGVFAVYMRQLRYLDPKTKEPLQGLPPEMLTGFNNPECITAEAIVVQIEVGDGTCTTLVHHVCRDKDAQAYFERPFIMPGKRIPGLAASFYWPNITRQ